MTGRVDHERAPIFETLVTYADSGMYGFHTPGHKSGRFAAPELAELVGPRGLALDLPSMTATDNTFHPTGCVREAQQLAADLFGAGDTFFLTAGSTLGVAAALLSAVLPGSTVAMPRNVHRSVVAGLVLSGGVPRFIPHDVLPECGALGVTPEALTAVLGSDPRPSAVLLTRPSYYGVARELTDVAEVCHAHGLPLIVDEAHGSHFGFLPQAVAGVSDPGYNPPAPALVAGADLVVQSCHKTLGSLVGSAQLHVGQESLVSSECVQHALNFLQTTSPSSLLLASLDVMRRWLWREGEQLFAAAVDEACNLADTINAIDGLAVFSSQSNPKLADHRHDPLRFVVNVSGTGWSGYDVERFLRTEYQVEDEMADWFNVVYVLSPHDDPSRTQAAHGGIVAGVAGPKRGHCRPNRASCRLAARRHHHCCSHQFRRSSWRLAMRPLRPKSRLRRETATGRTCAEMVMFYPPGIPVLMPGEIVSQETVEVCQRLLAAGANPYASDPTLATIRVVA